MFTELIAFADPNSWANMFTLGEGVTWLEKIIRPIIIYITLVVLLRLVGKRELAQLNPLDLVVILSLSNTVQNAIIGDDTSLVGGIVGACALLAINYAVAYVKFRWPKVEAVTEGKPITLIENGRINHAMLKRELMTESDLDIVAHENGLENASDLKELVLNPNGSFLVEGKDDIRDDKFKHDVLRKIDELSKQISSLNASLAKTS